MRVRYFFDARSGSSWSLVAAALTLAAVTAVAGRASGQETQPASPRVLTLVAVERAALEQQPQIRVARAQTAVAAATADEVRAPLLPQVTGSAQYAHEWGNYHPLGTTATTASGGGLGLSTQYNVFSFGLSATQLIYDFGQTTEKYSAAKDTVDAQRSEEQVTRVTIVSGVRRAYFAARANKELVDVAQETLSDQQKHLSQVKGFVDVGTQPEIALAQQKAAVANAQVQLITAQNNYETSKAMLNQAAGLIGGTDYDVGDEKLEALADEEQPLETLVQKAMSARPELANLAQQREAQLATERSAKGGYGPTLSASAGANEAGETLDALGPNINVGVILTWPVFQGGLTIGQVRQAEAGLASIDAQQSLEVLQVRLDVTSAQLALHAAKATIGAADEAAASAREQLRLAEQRYATGVGSIIELNDAQVAYTSAEAQAVQARYSLASARAQLLAALGRT
jgi:outer membrane protein